jgi:transcriptional regulator with XRE-family HTH domain
MQQSEPVTTGERVRTCRRFRGVSLQVLADRTGLSKSFLSMVENGHRRLERRRDLIAIATALQVSMTDLTGQPYPPTTPADGGAHATVPGVRTALMAHSLDYTPATALRPVEQLAADTTAVMTLRQNCQDAAVGRQLAGLLPKLHAAALHGDDVPRALRALVLATKAATSWLKTLGYHDLAWIAADRGWHAAVRLDDPVYVAAADYSRAQALSGLGAHDQIGAIAAHAAEAIPRTSSDGLQVFGMLRLTQALAATTTGVGDPHAALAEAREVAEHTGQGTAFWFMFGPANVAQWTMDITLERGDPAAAVAVAEALDPRDILVGSRRAAYWIHYGVALAQLRGRDLDALAALRQAERLAPDRVYNSPRVRDLIVTMLHRARRTAGSRDLRGLAHRIGVTP